MQPDVFETNDTEMRKADMHLTHQLIQPPCTVNAERFSKWRRLYQAQTRLRRCASILSARAKGKPIPAGSFKTDEYELAENDLFRMAQFTYFAEEINSLKHRPTVNKSSLLKIYSPYLDEHGVIRMRGRIDSTPMIEEEFKRPIILPRQHHITYLLVLDYHTRFHHCNNETVINELRQRFLIARLRAFLKTIRSRCRKCQLRKAMPCVPMMAPLPAARLAAYTRPFTFAGVDCFGPIMVAFGRRNEKRWGMLFTCLTIRAIHIEIAHSLNTDSCIMCLRNFIARRGTPLEIFSDNGSNFHGANNELQKALLQFQEIGDYPHIKWRFNPPAAPHMGGSWERLIGSVKKVLTEIMPLRKPTDEVLRAIFIEAESIVNTRPLTFVSLEHEDDEALTPNHFLLGSSNGYKPPGEFDDSGLLLRQNWRKAQHLANLFWQRWLKEYLPTITRRTKWFTPTKNVAIGDIVIIVDGTQPRNTWLKGRVTQTLAGKDGVVRRATVLTKNGEFVRPVVKLAILDVNIIDKSTE